MEAFNQPVHQRPEETGQENVIENDETPKYRLPKEYFDLQLKFASAVAKKFNKPLSDILLTHTNLHRNFRQAFPDRRDDNPVWQEYLKRISDKQNDFEALVDETHRFYLEPHESNILFREMPEFGFFTFDYVPDENDPNRAVVEIHTVSGPDKEKNEASPIGEKERPQRLQDLHDLFQFIKDHPKEFPHLRKEVQGGSWLYDPEKKGYRELFPPEYIASAQVEKKDLFQGLGSWGQFFDRTGRVNEKVAKQLLDNLEGVTNFEDIYKAFPYKTHTTQAPIEAFYNYEPYRIK